MTTEGAPHIDRLADLLIGLGANVQPGQIVAISSEPGKEPLARALAHAAYKRGAKFVDVSVFDLHVKRARLLHSDPKLLEFVPSWYGDRQRALGKERAAAVSLSGPVAPHLLDDIDPVLLGKDMLPNVKEAIDLVLERTLNWTIGPCATPAWATMVFPDLEPDAALSRLWELLATACRLDHDDPIAAWEDRLNELESASARLNARALRTVRFQGPGTDLSVGLFRSSRWQVARLSTVGGIVHAPNLPTEEVFTTPDPAQVEGVVSSTKPLLVSGGLVTGLRIRFASGRAVEIDAEQGADTVRTLAARDRGAARLGEVALVDRESRVGSLDTIFFDSLLDENAASHIALGQGLEFAVDDESDAARVNDSELHVDFMIGGDQVVVTGTDWSGREFPLLRGGVWQI